MDEASEVESSLRNLFLRVMTVNFGAVNSTSMVLLIFTSLNIPINEFWLQTFTHALYHLAAMPDYIQLMRDEVVAVVSEEGWTKNAISKMYKVDSFLKETQRFNGIGSCAQVI
jgi:Cytochrome P450